MAPPREKIFEKVALKQRLDVMRKSRSLAVLREELQKTESLCEQLDAILKDIKNGDHFYFVHSYQMRVFSHEERLAHVDYGGDITAIVAKDNMVGLQFHPEKSDKMGLRIVENFITL